MKTGDCAGLCGESDVLPVLWGQRDGGTAERVVEPCVLGVGRGEEALEIERVAHALDESAGLVEQGKEAVPVDGEEKRGVGRKQGSAAGEWCGAAPQLIDGKPHNGLGLRELGDENQFLRAGDFECAEQIALKQRFEAAFGRHPHRMRLEKSLEYVTGSGV